MPYHIAIPCRAKQGAAAIASILLQNRTLTSLQLGHNGISNTGGLAFGSALQASASSSSSSSSSGGGTRLEHLDLQGNLLADDAFTTPGRGLAEAVRKCRSLRLLDVAQNLPGLGKTGCKAVAGTLSASASALASSRYTTPHTTTPSPQKYHLLCLVLLLLVISQPPCWTAAPLCSTPVTSCSKTHMAASKTSVTSAPPLHQGQCWDRQI